MNRTVAHENENGETLQEIVAKASERSHDPVLRTSISGQMPVLLRFRWSSSNASGESSNEITLRM